MMRAPITDEQARPLAALLAALHPGWDIPGIRAALHKARHKAPADELAIAAIRCAMRADLKSPALIAEDGPHWHGTEAARDTRFERCPVDGHRSYPAWNCGACRADRYGLADDDAPAVSPITHLTPEQAATNARGARAVIAALNANRTTTTEEKS